MVTSVAFNFVIYCIIFANTITLALYRHDQSDAQTRVLLICDVAFIWIFALEMIAKIVGLGFTSYIKDKFNVFDTIIVIIGAVDFALNLAVEDAEQGSTDGVMSALRALRLLRVIKLARHW